jgi:thioredoxin-like negative regulator of GroEL
LNISKNQQLMRFLPLIILLIMLGGVSLIFLVMYNSGAIVMTDKQTSSPVINQTTKEKPTWVWDEEKFGKLRVLDIGRNDCVACVKMHQIMLEMKDEYQGKVIFEIVNMEEYPNIQREFNISSIPTIVVLDGMGRELYRKEGVWYKTEIREFFANLGIKP